VTTSIGVLPAWADELLDAAAEAGEDVKRGIVLATQWGRELPQPGEGSTAHRWGVLAAVAERELTVARILEAHTDALAILHEAGVVAPDGGWGVFAAEAPGTRLEAEHAATVTLSGVKPWCSLAGLLDHALVTAHRDGSRGLYAINLKHPSVSVEPPDRWVARGLREVTSAAIRLDRTPADPVGEPGWYLDRPGFAWGGMGVAACWYGGARGLYRTLCERATTSGGDIPALHVGVVDVALHAAEATLDSAAEAIDSAHATGRAGATLALRVRSVVAEAAERVVHQVGHALGPAPLAFDEQHARRVADLELYVRQHHAERDLAALGAELLGRRGK
jgi:alkylation response protein AidB-like acyl-CoA dehydrogenase